MRAKRLSRGETTKTKMKAKAMVLEDQRGPPLRAPWRYVMRRAVRQPRTLLGLPRGRQRVQAKRKGGGEGVASLWVSESENRNQDKPPPSPCCLDCQGCWRFFGATGFWPGQKKLRRRRVEMKRVAFWRQQQRG